MNEIDLVGMANAILRQRDLVNSLMQENAQVKAENKELKERLEAAHDALLELQERQE
jgi:regulator of replication initiation timing